MAACRSAAALGAAALAGFGGLAYVIRRRALARRRRTSCACLACDALRASSTPPRAAKRRPSAMEPAPEDSTPVNNDRLNSNPVATSKRESALTWDEYFMAVAFLSAQRSKDPNRQVGACVVNADKKIVGIGYNGFPWGCSDDDLPWGKRGDSALETKYPYVCHAELNAIMNANSTTLKVRCRAHTCQMPVGWHAPPPLTRGQRAVSCCVCARLVRRRGARSTSRSSRATNAPSSSSRRASPVSFSSPTATTTVR